MTAFSEKHSKKAHSRQAEREARKAKNRQIEPERIAAVHILPDGRELIELKGRHIPGYTYSF